MLKPCSGDVDCHQVNGYITTVSGDVTCGDVSGDVITVSGDINRKSSLTESDMLTEAKKMAVEMMFWPACPARYMIIVSTL